MDKIYIFGDSFCAADEYNHNSWTVKLRKNYEVINEAEPGSSNHQIFLKFLKYCNLMEDNSTVILAWSDTTRFYLNPGIARTDYLYNMHWENFYNPILDELYQRLYISEVKRLTEIKKLRLLVFWAFPSGYDLGVENANWLFKVSDESAYTYLDAFDNEVKPPLIHFSKKEIEHLNINNHRRVAEYFIDDRRSNHLGDQRMHDALYNIVCDFAQGRIAGQINLNYRLNNGS
jgi:hypothetical protein